MHTNELGIRLSQRKVFYEHILPLDFVTKYGKVHQYQDFYWISDEKKDTPRAIKHLIEQLNLLNVVDEDNKSIIGRFDFRNTATITRLIEFNSPRVLLKGCKQAV